MIIIINGQGGSGKDQFIEYVQEEFDFGMVNNLSSVDRVKEAAELLGWDSVKDEHGRLFLSELKKLSTEFYNGPISYLVEFIDVLPKTHHIFVHIREPEEIDKFKSWYPDAKTMLVERFGERVLGNVSDDRVANYNYDYYVDNTKGLFELKNIAKNFVEYELKSLCYTCLKADKTCPVYPQETRSCVVYNAK